MTSKRNERRLLTAISALCGSTALDDEDVEELLDHIHDIGKPEKDKPLNFRQRYILKALKDGASLTVLAGRRRGLLNVPGEPRTPVAHRLIKGLVERGLLRAKAGPKKSTVYELVK